MSRLNAPLREPGGDAANFLHGPADQGFGFAGASLAADFSAIAANPWKLAPLVLLIVVVTCFQLVVPSEEVTQ